MAAAVQLFEHMPENSGMAFVVILHLSAEHESHAAGILQRTTSMPVIQVTETIAIQANHVYVIAPGLHLSMDDGHLVSNVLDRPRGRPVAIDLFFRTLANAHRERAVAVVLSGTGSDGAVGLGDIKVQGGVAIAQAPRDAEYPGMPEAAIAAGRIDFILSAPEIAAKLVELWENAKKIELPDAEALEIRASEPTGATAAAAAEVALQEVMAILSARTSNDFRHYKRGTVLRRIERRLQVTRQHNLRAYRDYLEVHPQEAGHLLQDMLISVTSFFRDHDAFEALERELAATVFERHPSPRQVRAWVVGCATGEEAYSLAMLLNDQAPTTGPRTSIQVFATDIDDRALTVARAGVYPEAIVADVAPTRLSQYFEKETGAYRIRKGLREQILFASHNVVRDPPFSRVDVISCRNLLIYLEREVQVQVLEAFHFALNPGGLLFLGSAESADFLSDRFTAVDKKHRIYRAKAVRSVRGTLSPPRFPLPPAIDTATYASPPLAHLHQRMLEERGQASLVVDAHHNILHTSQGASRYLRHVEGLPSQNLQQVVLPQLASALMPALLLASSAGKRVAAKPVTIDADHGPIVVQMTALGAGIGIKSGQLLVLFDEADVSLSVANATDPDGTDPAVAVLEREVRRLQEQLDGSRDDSTASGEALRASNEELQSINEELRSATEELETSKEELQSVNEELTTVNFELKSKIEETAKVNDDLSNLITSMNIATVFVDRMMRIRGFTPLATSVFNIRTADVGRSLQDLTHRLSHDTLADDVQRMLTTLQPVERELAATDGRWYMMRISPYRTEDDRIDGAVLNFIDVTVRRMAQEQLRARDERLRLVAESTRDYAVVTLDASGHITGWNKGAELMFGYQTNEVLGVYFGLLFVPEDRAAGQPERELREAKQSGRAADERWHLRKDGSRFYCSGITTPLLEGEVEGFAKIARDLTERQLLEKQREELLQAEKQIRRQLEAASAARSEFLAVMSHELKNPLNLILMSSELLGRAPTVRSDPRLARSVDTIRRTVQGQSQIIDDLLDLSRLHTGKMALNRTAVQWRPIIERIVDALRGEADLKRITLTVNAEDLTVYADVVRVEQIVWNLMSNAMKFTPDGGAVMVGLTRESGMAVLEVQDTGRGIEPQHLGIVFDMFEQCVARASTRSDGGLGIGLALVKSLTELQGGSVEARSKGKNQGATFTVTLPLFEGGNIGDARYDVSPVRILQDQRVLLVDDDRATLETLVDLLESEGALVASAASAPAALEEIKRADFDLLISDIGMPGMSGLELVEQLRQMPNGKGVAAIAVSGFVSTEDKNKSVAAGFNAHLNKPLSLDELGEVLLRLMRPSA
ncbi:two-component system, chemotaxis family, CheB/CheR fusion protein [Caldimonas brevitalea]|uniref:histidine kinase n=2 Tax=Caldimonas brevitalea TaxID=413882 RepID=A0A0G3BCV0_9BURK|nr:two-component system, chemotaxis family, CheB/CheR fusion protein [Caldimonas brevitalea]